MRVPLWILRSLEGISDRASERPEQNARRMRGLVQPSGPPHGGGAAPVRHHLPGASWWLLGVLPEGRLTDRMDRSTILRENVRWHNVYRVN